MFHVPEKFRISEKENKFLGSDSGYGNNGAFRIRISNVACFFIVASDGEGWEHVSVHVSDCGSNRTPTWDEMCKIKFLFWDESDCIIQYHPSKEEYVNNHKHTLHLWKPITEQIPIPPSIMVGIK